MTDAPPYASLRSVLVDGSPRARIEGMIVDLAISADGHHAVVTHRPFEEGTERVTRVSLDDGRTERLATGFVAGRRKRRWFTSGDGRIVDALPTPEAFAPFVRGVRVVPRRDDESVLGLTPDGAWVVLSRLDGASLTLRALRFDDGAERVFEAVPPWFPEGLAIADGLVALVTERGELLQLRFDDGARRAAALPASSSWSMVAERGGARVVCRGGASVIVYELDPLREVSRADVSVYTRPLHAAGGRVLLLECGTAEYRFVVRGLDDVSPLPLRATPRGPCAALTPDGARVVYVEDCVVRVADLARGRHLDLHDGPDSPTARLAWSLDGSLVAAAGRDHTVRVIDARSRALRWIFESKAPPSLEWVNPHLCFTPDGGALLLASHHGFTHWSLSTGEELARFAWPGTAAPFYDVALSPDGRIVAVAGPSLRGDAGVTLLDLHAEMRVMAAWDLPAVREPRDSWLRFEGADTLRWSVRRAHQNGQVATYRLSLEGRAIDHALRSLRKAAKTLPLDGDDRWVVVDRARIALESMKITGAARGRGFDGLACLTPLDARAGVVAVTVRVGGEWGLSLAVYDCASERVIGVSRDARTPLDAALSPDGTRVAVSYGDGAFAVFAIDRG